MILACPRYIFSKRIAFCNDFHFSSMNEWPHLLKRGQMTARATLVQHRLIMIHIDMTWLQSCKTSDSTTNINSLEHRNHRVNPKMNHVQNPETERMRQDGTCSAPYFYRGTCPFSVNLLNYTQGMKACGVTSSGSGRLYIISINLSIIVVLLGICTAKWERHFCSLESSLARWFSRKVM